jgi:glycosyltransferase involved in cell wall biosynthesis
MLVTVIIPTMGRVTLERSIMSILNQTFQVSEIIIVDSSPEGIKDFEFLTSPLVRVLRKSDADLRESLGIWSAAHNRNLGIQHARSTYIAFMDDDDEWHSNKMQVQMDAIDGRLNIISSTSVEFLLPSGKALSRPSKLFNLNSRVLECFYGKITFHRSEFYIATPTLVIPSVIAKVIPMHEELSWYEDTWWLYQLECAGLFHEQLSQKLVTIHADPKRSIARDSLAKHFEWAEYLETVSTKYAVNYLLGIALRNTIWLRRFREIPKLVFRAIQVTRT